MGFLRPLLRIPFCDHEWVKRGQSTTFTHPFPAELDGGARVVVQENIRIREGCVKCLRGRRRREHGDVYEVELNKVD